MSGLVYSLIAPYTHRSVHAIPTGSKTLLRRSRRRGQATGQWPAASAPSGQSLGSAGRGARRRSLGAGRAGSGGAATQSGRAARGCKGCGQRAVQAVLVGANEVRYRQGRASSGRPLRRRAAGYNRPARPRTSNCSVRGLSRACRTQRRLHGDIEISIVGLQHADRYISVVNTDTAQWSRPDLLCLVAGPGVVAVEERALLGSCDRRTAVGRRDYAVIITLLWLGAAGREAAGHHRRERAHRRQRHKNNDRFDSKRAMMPRSVSHDRQRSAGILTRRSSPNSTSCPDPTSAAIRKHLPPAPLVNCGPSGTRAVTRPLDRTGAV